MSREYENWGHKCLQNNPLTESGIWESEKNKVKKWCIGYVWKYVNLGMWFGGDIFSPFEHNKKDILQILIFSKKKHNSIYTTFQHFSLPKSPYFRFSRRFSTIAKTFSAHGLNSLFAGAYLYSLSCVQKTAQNAVTHWETNPFPDSLNAVHY